MFGFAMMITIYIDKSTPNIGQNHISSHQQRTPLEDEKGKIRTFTFFLKT